MRMNNSALPAPAEGASTGFEVGRYARLSRDGFGICIDGAVGYSLRLIPSNKTLGQFGTTHDAWPAVVAALEAGRASRTLVLDWLGPDGTRHRMTSGAKLEYLARAGLGLPAEHLRSANQRRR
ncbi:MAG: hypothetical protein HW391_1140 [Chloroflexi bacterium]|nr:hypothetical protein [Chloroflexota bacterium]